MGVSSFEAGKYKAVFLNYLEKAENFAKAKELMERFDHLSDMQCVYGDKLVTIMEYRDDFLSLCEILRSEYGFTSDFDEAHGRVKMLYEIRREEEEIAYRRLEKMLHSDAEGAEKIKMIRGGLYNEAEKLVQEYGHYGPLRGLLVDEKDADARRKCFRRLLSQEGEIMYPQEMLSVFHDELYHAYRDALAAELD